MSVPFHAMINHQSNGVLPGLAETMAWIGGHCDDYALERKTRVRHFRPPRRTIAVCRAGYRTMSVGEAIADDAHSINELDHMHWGIGMARIGGVPAQRVLNAMSLAAPSKPNPAPGCSERSTELDEAGCRPRATSRA